MELECNAINNTASMIAITQRKICYLQLFQNKINIHVNYKEMLKSSYVRGCLVDAFHESLHKTIHLHRFFIFCVFRERIVEEDMRCGYVNKMEDSANCAD